MYLKTITSLSISWRSTYVHRGELVDLLVTVLNLKSATVHMVILGSALLIIVKVNHIISTINFLEISIIILIFLIIPFLIVRVIMVIYGSYPWFMCDYYWTIHILMLLMVSQSPIIQYLLCVLSHCQVFAFGNQYIARFMTPISLPVALNTFLLGWYHRIFGPSLSFSKLTILSAP